MRAFAVQWQLLGAFTQRFRELRGVIEAGRQQHGEAVARDARGKCTGRQAAATSSPSWPITASPTCMPKLSLMTCSWSESM